MPISPILFISTLFVTVLLHELGHFIVAKLVRCKVEIFSVGFGKPLWKKTWKGTQWQIAPILLGGFCKLKDELVFSRSKYAFANLPYRKKLAIVIAGCVVNISTGIIILVFNIFINNFDLYWIGYLNIVLGITNLLPLAPCLDGGYLVYLPLLIKLHGKTKGIKYFEKANKVSFWIVMILNIVSIPYIIFSPIWK